VHDIEWMMTRMSDDDFEEREEIAIVGMAGRFPGARDVDEFWANLREGVESIRSFSPEELASAQVSSETLENPNFVNSGALADDLDCFDAGFFGITKREAEIMDPQHRVFLETAWQALENAGYDPERYDGFIGVFGGVAPNTYRQNILSRRPELLAKVGDYLSMISSEKEYAITRVAFKLNLRGPSLSVNTACSTSAVALHLACQSLLAGENDMCLVGGARVKAPLTAGYVYLEDGIPSPDGHCRAFDADARGTAIGNGVAVIAVKRLSDAIRDRDTIHAVVKSTAVNNDGSAKVGFTAPSVQGQAAVIAEAQAMAGVSGDDIQYVEAHGTGTGLGDPIEVAALTKAFRKTTDETGFCALGSVKTNIGHMDAGAGITGVIKTALSLEHGEIPPSLHYERPNPQIDFENSPFFVNAALRPWPEVDVRRAGVSSFGLGGTNAHIILEQAPQRPAPTAPHRKTQILTLSARSAKTLNAMTARMAAHLKDDPESELADIAYTLQQGRRAFEHRRVLACSSPAEASELLESRNPRRVFTRQISAASPSITFMYPGVATQYPQMGRGLYETEAVFREYMDRGLDLLAPQVDFDLRELLLGENSNSDESTAELDRPSIQTPAIFIVEYALTQLWKSLGIEPEALIGLSLGENTASAVAGSLSYEDCLGLVTLRGQIFEDVPNGGMLSIPLSADELRARIGDELDLATINAPEMCAVSGPLSEIRNLAAALQDEGIEANRVNIATACHSRLLDPLLQRFEDYLRSIDLAPPEIPFVSNITGTWITEEEATDPMYWVRHLRNTVHFADGMSTLLETEGRVLIEVGPGRALGFLASQNPSADAGLPVVASMRHRSDATPDEVVFQGALGQLWTAGVDVDFALLNADEERQRVPLPTYPFERTRYWVEAPQESVAGSEHLASPEVLVQQGIALPVGEAQQGAASSSTAPSAETTRKERILSSLRSTIEDFTGLSEDEIDDKASFLELGLDSLMLTQANNEFQREFEIKITFRQLFESARTLDELADYIDGQLPANAMPAPAELTVMPAAQAPDSTQLAATLASDIAASIAPVAAGRGVDWLIQQQLEIMRQQLAYLRGEGTLPNAPAATTVPAVARIAPPTPEPLRNLRPADQAEEGEKPRGLGPWKPVEKGPGGVLTPIQQTHLDALIARFNAKTQESKRLTQRFRSRLSDPRSVAGFRQQWKELVYPIWSDRSKGSKLWDVDGNEWLDITMGFGVTLFGHSPDFITDAISRQLSKTMAIGPQTVLVGEVAEMLCELTGMERAAFCNTGSEAVLAAIRMARTVTGRDKIASFSNDYHGIFDEVLVRGVKVRGEMRSQPVAPGIPRSAVENLVVLDYGEDAALEAIRAQASELAAVLVEPVQSRNPELQPKEFLHKLRALTEELDIPLIFDEMITGFRLHPAGAQAYFGVKADIATYGKVIGGGMPIGVVAGKAHFLDSLDAGDWSFGDDSVPEAGVTWFAGTFVRHPLSIAAAHAALTKLIEEGPELQRGVNEKAHRFADQMNAWFNSHQYPIRIVHFSSLFLIKFEGDDEFAPLYWHHLRDLGIHTHERRPNFLTAAHSEQDMAQLTEACKEAARQLRSGGFLPLPRDGEQVVDVREAWQMPASEEQVEVFLACQMGHDASCAFNLSCSMHFRGDFQRDAMSLAIQQLVERHDSLRMRASVTGEVLSFVPKLELEIPFLDWSDLSEVQTQEKLDELTNDDLEREYDLRTGPLVRAQIARLGKDRHYVLFGVHHLAADGVSVGILTREIAEFYNANCTKTQVELPEPTQYTEYSKWQELQRRKPEFADAEAWWIQHITEPSFPPPLELPTDRPRPPRKTFVSTSCRTTISSELSDKLRKSGMQRGCTMFSTLLGGFSLWLHRLTGQDDVIVGIPVSGQSMIGSNSLVGHCAHHHPLRSRLAWDASVEDFLKGVQGTVLDAYDHRNYTEGTLVRKIQLPRDPSRLALVNVQFNMDPPAAGAQFHELESDVAFNDRHYNAPDITMNLTENADGGIVIRCDYNTDLFDAMTISRWLANFTVVLRGIADDPSQSVSDVPVLTDEEREILTLEWNAAASVDDSTDDHQPLSKYRGVHEWIERSAAEHPDSTAVVAPASGTTPMTLLTYRELNIRANLLARRLQRGGVELGDLVAICLDRTLDLHVALLAVWKVGGTYVPMDPGFPPGRLEQMLFDSEATALISTSTIAPQLEARDAVVCCLDEPDEYRVASQDSENLGLECPADSLAYVIYTSGSTGRPKGVEIPHRAVLNFLASMAKTPGFTESDRLLAVTTFSFDIAVLELLLPLCVGGQVVLAAVDDIYDGRRLIDLVETHAVTVMQATPASWRLMLEAGWKGSRKLRVLCGGEAIPAELADELAGCCESLFNMYGPTETTIWSTVARIEPGARPVTIGRPIANTQVYILDARGAPVPIGAVGELCIGGDGLAHGYRGRSELTAQNFILNPFADATDGSRLYRTGDLARFRPDGEIECLGRFDSQVKIRGYRVELGEIEERLSAFEGVKEATVLCREDLPGDRKLVAYIVFSENESHSASKLQSYLRESLPNYMIPAHYVELTSMPQTPNGKVDRNGLLPPDQDSLAATHEFVAPRTPEEKKLATIWCELLQIDRVGVDDDFFDLGGHSLTAIRMLARVREVFGVEIALRQVFKSPTVAAIACQLDAGEELELLI
jgi:amino acid adenylation domain-containing protein